MDDITELVKRAADGDRAAFDRLYEQTKNGVWFTCISLLKNEENAQDVMQDTYLTAFERLGTLSDPAAAQSWLNKIAANKCKNHIAAKSNSAVESGGDVLENIPDDELIPEEYVEDKAKRELIMKIIRDALSEEQYRTVILYYFDEMTAAEIAALMDCHEKTVLYRLKTARLKIKNAVERYERENREKLYAAAPLLSLSRLLRTAAENVSVPQAPVSAPPKNTHDIPRKTADSAAKTGGKAMLNSLKAKIIAGVSAAVVVGGGVTAGVVISNSSKSDTESRPSVSAPANPTNSGGSSAASTVENTSSADAQSSTPEEQSSVPVPSGDPVSPTGEILWDNIPEAPEGDFEFKTYRKDNRTDPDPDYVMITKYVGSGGYVKIPSTLGGKPVKAVYHMVYCNELLGVMIPDGVTEIKSYAFKDFKGLTSVVFPKNLEEIGYGAFEGCESLESVVLPDGLKHISYDAFVYCKKLKSVSVPDSVEYIGERAFENTAKGCEIRYKGEIYDPESIVGLFDS